MPQNNLLILERTIGKNEKGDLFGQHAESNTKRKREDI